jgi:hypothetical protein
MPGLVPSTQPLTSAPINSSRKMPNSHCAMVEADASTSLKPKIPAAMALSRKLKPISASAAPVPGFAYSKYV